MGNLDNECKCAREKCHLLLFIFSRMLRGKIHLASKKSSTKQSTHGQGEFVLVQSTLGEGKASKGCPPDETDASSISSGGLSSKFASHCDGYCLEPC